MTSIAVVVLDTLRKDAFDRHFEWLPGQRFEHAFSTGDWTVPAHASLFSGRYAAEVGVHAKSPHFDPKGPALAEHLRDAGYATRAYSANASVTGHLGFDRGFTDFRVPPAYEVPDADDVFDWRRFSRNTSRQGVRKYLTALRECVGGDYATLPSLLAGARLKLHEGREVEYGGTIEAGEAVDSMEFGGREFLFLNLMEAHEPLRAPGEYLSVEVPPLTNSVGDLAMGEVDGEHVRRAYDDCVRYLSDAYRELFADLREEFEYVITLSDHGEMLGESGAWGHEHGLQPELTHVPLVVSGEGFDDLAACEAPASLLDVHATVLDLAGLDDPGGGAAADADDGRNGNAPSTRGQSLREPASDREYLTEFHGLTVWSERKLERNGHGDRIERYDAPLRGYVGPPDCYAHETPDGIEVSGTAGAGDPAERIEDLAAGLDVSLVGDDEGVVPEEIRTQLEHLGYA